LARSRRGSSHPNAGRQWRVSADSKLGLISNGMVLQRDSVRGKLDLSVCIIPAAQPLRKMRLLGPTVTAAVSEAIRKDTGVISWLHWPNLVSIDGKIVGRTSSSSFSLPVAPGDGEKSAVVMDLGVNCFASPAAEHISTQLPKTSLLEVLGVKVDVALLRERILQSITWYYAEWERGMDRKLIQRMEPTVSWIGKQVQVKTIRGTRLSGRATRLREDGSLLLRQEEPKEGTAKIRAVAPELVEHVRMPP
jgi:BirA family transcriptional regulator, biotin operon repressor / biotin---[acetyl-CoA-carboxylase] ligase